MKKTLFALCSLLVTLPALAGFEGTIALKYSNEVSPNTGMTFYLSDTKVRVDLDYRNAELAATTVLLLDPSAAVMHLYNIASSNVDGKWYSSIPASDIDAKGVSMAGLTGKATGEIKEISGYSCEKYIFKTNASTTETWVAKAIDFDAAKYAPFFKTGVEMQGLAALHVKGFPVKTSTSDWRGTIISAWEIEKISTEKLSATTFQIPADYKNAADIKK